ncbi:MAG: hypothetical protein AB7O91_06065 [Sphingomonas sp.]
MSDEIRKVSRRSFITKVLGGAVIGTVAVIAPTAPAEAQFTDRDPYDPVGRGRRGRPYTGITDRDPYDPVGRGRGRRRRRTGITDRDPSDPVGNGRGRRRTGITDRDPSDPIGNGRGRRRRTGCTDSDAGRYADPAGNGRCRG